MCLFSPSVTGVKHHGRHVEKIIEIFSSNWIVEYKSYCRLLVCHHSRFPYTNTVFLT